MNEQELGEKITRLLDRGAAENIKQSTLYRLQSARRAALENCQPTEKIINAGVGISARGGHDWHFNAGKLLLLATLLVVFASIVYWHIPLENDDNATIDTMMLADDLPIDAYVDNEFDEWLNSE